MRTEAPSIHTASLSGLKTDVTVSALLLVLENNEELHCWYRILLRNKLFEPYGPFLRTVFSSLEVRVRNKFRAWSWLLLKSVLMKVDTYLFFPFAVSSLQHLSPFAKQEPLLVIVWWRKWTPWLSPRIPYVPLTQWVVAVFTRAQVTDFAALLQWLIKWMSMCQATRRRAVIKSVCYCNYA